VTQEEFDRLAALGVLENRPAKKAWHIDGEPDRVTWLSATGYPCIAQRNLLGAWCGYVGVREGHPGLNNESIHVHGGVTFSGFPGQWPQSLCSADPNHYIGFDCNHLGDKAPGIEHFLRDESDVYRDLAYARAECEKLATQLKALEETDD